jgi:hypothetical protein
MLIFDDPPARVTIEFGSEAFQHRFSRLFDLKEQRSAVAAREQTDCTERSHASDPDRLEGRPICDIGRIEIPQRSEVPNKAGAGGRRSIRH